MSILDLFSLQETASFEEKKVSRDAAGRPLATWQKAGEAACKRWLGTPSTIFKSDRFTTKVTATLAMRPPDFEIPPGSRATVGGRRYGVIGTDDVAGEGEVILVFLEEQKDV